MSLKDEWLLVWKVIRKYVFVLAFKIGVNAQGLKKSVYYFWCNDECRKNHHKVCNW